MAVDTLKIANQLKEAGFTQQQAEASARVFSDFASQELASKRDLQEVEIKLDAKLDKLESKMDKVLAETKLWIMGTGLALAGFIIAALRFLSPQG